MTNEFEEIETNEEAPSTEFSEVPNEANSMIAAGAAGDVYDWSKAPEGIKAPPRIDLNGKTVTIKKADIVIPPESREWVKARSGNSEYKYCTFVLHYDIDGQQEFYSGVRVFKRDGDKYSHPTFMRDRKNQASNLLGLYADFKEKDIAEVSLREFLGFLNGQPKALIEVEEVKNPTNGDLIQKNMVGKFINS